MIVDTSAIVAILFDEPENAAFSAALHDAQTCRISAVNFVEAAVVAEKNGDAAGLRDLDALMRTAGIVIAGVSEEQAYVAQRAYSDFGKGRHPARLNLGDCFAYALATVSREPLLFKGDDFRKTDVKPAL